MTRRRPTLAILTTALLLPLLASPLGAHEIETRISTSGLDTLGPAIAAQIPSQLALPDIEIGLFECNGDDASITIQSTEIDLEIAEVELSQPRAGQLQLDLRFSAAAAGEIRFNRVIFCGSEFTCQNTIALQDVGARVLLESGTGDDGALGLQVVDVDLDLDADRFEFALSGCQYAEMVNDLVDLFETVGVSVLANMVEGIVQDNLAPAIENSAAGISEKSLSLLQWQLSVALQSLDLSDGIRVRADADIRAEASPASCLQDPGEPADHPGAPPQLSVESDVNMSLNLGLIDDLLYHVWSSTAQCPSLQGDAGFIGDYLAGFPNGTDWRLEATVASPPRIQGVDSSDIALELVFNDIALLLEAKLPNGTSKRAQVVLDARASVGLVVDHAAGALGLQFDDARVTRLIIDDELALADQGFDAASITQFVNDVYLPQQLASYLESEVSLPLGFGFGSTHLIVRELRSNSAYASLGLDLFVAPKNDTGAPDTMIADAPGGLVRPSDALVYVSGTDTQIPSELLRYQVRVNGIEMPTSTTSRLQIGLPNHSATYTVEVSAMDLAGNVDLSPSRTTVEVDGIRPTVEVDYTVSDNAVAIDFSATDDRSESNRLRTRIIVTDVYSGDEVQSREIEAGRDSVRLSGLGSNRFYRVTVVVEDQVGNEGLKSFVITTASVGGCSASGSTSSRGAILLLLALLLSLIDRRRLVRSLILTMALFGAACAQGEGAVGGGSEALELPECASDLSRAMWSNMQEVSDRSTIAMDRALGRASRVDPTLYIDGPEIFGKWASLIEEAELEINMQFYKWEPETDATETILAGIKALQERRRRENAQEAIPVRVVIDTSALGVAAPTTEEHMPWVMERIEAYELDPNYIDLTFAVVERGFLDQFSNLHVKTMVVDGRVAIITGANPEHQHNFDKPWHDLGTVFYGDIVRGVLDDIDYTWRDAERWICPSQFRDRATCLVPATAIEHRNLPAETNLASNACTILGLSRMPSLTANNSVDNPQDQAFLAAFYGAEKVIKIETPNINDDAVKLAIIDAVQRGVEVRIITSKEFNEVSEGFVGGPNGQNVSELYRDLALLGVEDACSKLRVRWYSQDGSTPIVGNGDYASHTKYTSVDEQIVIVGTTNMDTASWNFSHELNLAIDDADMARTLNAQLFDADWDKAVNVDACNDN